MMKNRGKIDVIGIGSGKREYLTLKAIESLEKADIIVGYSAYITQIESWLSGKTFEEGVMKKEVERCKRCIELADGGMNVALISSGDAGVYGMAGLMLELNTDIEVNIICGVTSCIEASAVLGAPLMNDFITISLSDLLTPYEKIMKRVKAAAESDTVICFYNPKSTKRINHIKEAFEIIKKYQSSDTPVGIVKNAGRETEESFISTIIEINFDEIDMNTMVVIGNSETVVKNGKMITLRGYEKNE